MAVSTNTKFSHPHFLLDAQWSIGSGTVRDIRTGERAAFKKLTTDEERACFVDQFWERRNPTVGSAENAFKTEHLPVHVDGRSEISFFRFVDKSGRGDFHLAPRQRALINSFTIGWYFVVAAFVYATYRSQLFVPP
jgi:hypothetical protein